MIIDTPLARLATALKSVGRVGRSEHAGEPDQRIVVAGGAQLDQSADEDRVVGRELSDDATFEDGDNLLLVRLDPFCGLPMGFLRHLLLFGRFLLLQHHPIFNVGHSSLPSCRNRFTTW
ncbi:hypothetical protein DAA51_38755 [Bradyrhizobium sp. WBAH10]|nr:hypothetical protein [Bradyrhizobium sp. WBAH33]MDD1594803.1 hypothetical protein [Bradyrhizobium sp. WBAH42]NRB92354.1 hypothetical protein [Bradyrhizobium sp. WBAH10]QCJ78921.1 hypothetical protein DAA51_38755 [Bradyrhizobium sp. WBAH10]QCK01083.1 hypothetical protein DAA61_38995 [Bradyrhizobium sp. WBAH33]